MATTTEPITATSIGVYPLASGDRLSRAEFEHRFSAMPEVKKAELIQGVVYVGSPVRVEQHGQQHALIVGWAMNYAAATPGLRVADNATVRLGPENEPQPDMLIRILPEFGGCTKLESGYIVGPPEFVVEIAASSASYDLHDKLAAYRDAGVKEYVVWRVLDGQLDWFVLTNGAYVKQGPNTDGILESAQFPGLRLHLPSLLQENAAAVFQTLQAGIATPEHAAFVSQLAEQRKK